tara:strand:+ start:413 stop:568 length:156 start_codon:yes stop_codon:yes gene_type:complete
VTEMLAQLLTETRAMATLARANHTDATTLASTTQQLLVQRVQAGQQVMVAG